MLAYRRNLTSCDSEVKEGCDVFNRLRSEMIQVEDAELVGAKGFTISTALNFFITRSAVNVRALSKVSSCLSRHYSGLS